MNMTTPPPAPPASGRGVAEAAFQGLCPRCGAQSLFQGVVGFAPKCRACGLDFSAFNVGDGPAAFLILVIGAIITGLASVLELTAEPPFWLHLLLWPVVTLVAVLGSLRLAKGALIALEYRHSAREGRVSD
jgi:uncharacterized protein (DUF983 family)